MAINQTIASSQMLGMENLIMDHFICVVFRGNFMLRTDGCHTRVIEILDHLYEQRVPLIVYTDDLSGFWNWTDQHIASFRSRYKDCELIIERQTELQRVLGKMTALIRTAALLLGHVLPLSFAERFARPLLHALKASGRVCGFVLSYTASHTIIAPHKPYIVDQHDFDLLSQLMVGGKGRQIGPRGLLRFKRQFEIENRAEAVIGISFNEHILNQSMYGFQKCIYLAPAPPKQDLPNGPYLYDLLIIASRHISNVESMIRFFDEVFPKISHLRVAIAGNICEDQTIQSEARKFPTITLLGYVEECNPLYSSCKAVFSPKEGSGIQLKIVEGLAAGRPVFAKAGSNIAFPPNYEGCIFPLDPRTILKVLENDKTLADAIAATSSYYDKYLTFNSPEKLITWATSIVQR